MLKSANFESSNEYNTHFKSDGCRLWLWQQKAIGGVLTNPAWLLRRTVTYEVTDLKRFKVEEARFDGNAFQINIEVSGPPRSYNTSTVPSEIIEQQGYDTLKFPIHIMSHSPQWRMVRTTTEARSSPRNFSIPAATSLLLGNFSYPPSTDQDLWIKNQQKAMKCEAEYTQKALRNFTNVQAECVRISTWILVKITFNTPEAAQDINEQFVLDDLAQKYKVKGPPGSFSLPSRPKTMPQGSERPRDPLVP